MSSNSAKAKRALLIVIAAWAVGMVGMGMVSLGAETLGKLIVAVAIAVGLTNIARGIVANHTGN